jgi:ParB-like chromosome segregation protein Spo0J
MQVAIDNNEARGASPTSLTAIIREAKERGRFHDFCHKVEVVALSQLVPHKANARTHSHKQVQKIAESMARFGVCNPVLIDDENQIIAGHGRVEAAKLLGLTALPTLRLSHLSDVEKRAYVIADNRLAELAGWDCDILAREAARPR